MNSAWTRPTVAICVGRTVSAREAWGPRPLDAGAMCWSVSVQEIDYRGHELLWGERMGEVALIGDFHSVDVVCNRRDLSGRG